MQESPSVPDRLLRADVLQHEIGEAIRVVQMGLMAGPGEDDEATALDDGMGITAVRDRDHRILVSPDDEHARPIEQVQLVEGGDALARGADDAAQGRKERSTPVLLAQP